MKTLLKYFFFAFFIYLAPLVSPTSNIVDNFDLDTHEYIEISSRSKDNVEPIIHSQSMILFYPADAKIRYIMASFDFDSYSKKYLFKRNTNGLFFVKIPIPIGIKKINYRLIIDGIWTYDKFNKNIIYEREGVAAFSYIDIDSNNVYDLLENPIILKNGEVEFFYKGEGDEIVTIAGNFNGWNPFVHRLIEDESGVYKIRLKIPKGFKMYYYFVISGNKILDKNNPKKTLLSEVSENSSFEVSYFEMPAL